ncbi:XRE family transcriptional regulator [Psychrobacter sp. 1501(2011)]|nr:XRE family transcriptional regulator [Psychrobacter sp. 1501(2011)]
MQVLFTIKIGVFSVIVNHLPTLLAERRLKVADAVRATGISKTTLHKIYNDQSSRIDFDTIDKLCEFLEVEVGDIFEYVPGAEELDLKK